MSRKQFLALYIFAASVCVMAASYTEKQIDRIKPNTESQVTIESNLAVDNNLDVVLDIGAQSGVFTGSLQATDIEATNNLSVGSLVANRALVSDGSGFVVESGVNENELDTLVGINTGSSIQFQLNNKEAKIPWSATGQLIYGNASNLTTLLNAGTNGQVLTLSGGLPSWQNPASASPLTTNGDLYYYNSGNARLPIGSNGQILSIVSGLPAWTAAPSSSPTTTLGDLIYRGVSVDQRLGIGSNGQLLTVSGGIPSWQNAPVSLPTQTGNAGKVLVTDGTSAAWELQELHSRKVKNNLLKCPSFEYCYGDIDSSGTVSAGVNTSGVFARSNQDSFYNDEEYRVISSTAATGSYLVTITDADFSGKQMVAYCEIKTANTNVIFRVGANGTQSASVNVASDGTYAYYKLNFVGGSTSSFFEIKNSDSTLTPNFSIDNCFIGKQSPSADSAFIDNNTAWKVASTSMEISATTTAPAKGTTSVDKVYWKRVGDSAHIRIFYRQTSAGTAGSGDYLFKVPSEIGLIDTSKLEVYNTVEGWSSSYQNAWVIGQVSAHDGTNDLQGEVVAYDSQYVRGFGHLATSVAGAIGSAGLQLSGANVAYALDFVVPILGWSATSEGVVQNIEKTISDENDFNATISSTGVHSNENFDFISTSSNPSTGNYTINFQSNLFSVAPVCFITITSNADFGWRITATTTTSLTYQTLTTSTGALASQGVNLKCTRSSTDFKKSAVIVGSFDQFKSVSASYWVSANFAASTTTPVNFDSKEYDTHNLCVPSPTVFKCTIPSGKGGTYRLGGMITMGGTSSYYGVYKNGTLYKMIGYSSGNATCNPSSDLQLSSGDYIDVRPITSGTVQGGALNASGTSNFSITRLGN